MTKINQKMIPKQIKKINRIEVEMVYLRYLKVKILTMETIDPFDLSKIMN